MDYKAKAKELREVTRELRLLNPKTRELQLEEERRVQELIDAFIIVGNILRRSLLNLKETINHETIKFKSGGIVHERPEDEPIVGPNLRDRMEYFHSLNYPKEFKIINPDSLV